jgi:cyanate permease
MVGPVITGWLVDRTGDFTSAFVLSAVIALAGAVGWALVIRKVEPLDWSLEHALRAQALPQGAAGGA